VNRLADVVVAGAGLVLTSPFLGLAALGIKLEDRGPVVYRQTRVGKDGEDFELLKLRTMVVGAEKLGSGFAVNEGDPRITRLGRLLRRTSVDELPQLWNVLRGDMSLVGPRPIVDDEVNKYGEAYRMYKKVIPGITGLWQVSGRNNTTYDVRVDLDTFYVRNWSPWFDLYVLLRTVKVVLLREGAY